LRKRFGVGDTVRFKGSSSWATLAMALILGGFCQSRILELHGQRMIERNFAPGIIIKNQIKDLNAALETASRLGVTLPLTQQVRQLFVDLAESGNEMLDHSALIR
jgi:2-hydroxy-3-oxopropionate reductase